MILSFWDGEGLVGWRGWQPVGMNENRSDEGEADDREWWGKGKSWPTIFFAFFYFNPALF